MAKERVDTLRGWFESHGRQLEPAMLRAALEERGADQDLIVELIDEGADWRREHPQPAPVASEPRRNGRPPPGQDAALVPPQNLEAEEHVLGAVMLTAGAVTVCRDILSESGSEFYRESHAKIWKAVLHLADTGRPVDAITLTAELDQRGDLADVGGRVRLHELAALVPATPNVGHYARIVAATARRRDLIRAGGEISRLGWEGTDDEHLLVDQARQIIHTVEPPPGAAPPPEAVHAGDAIFEEPLDTSEIRIWGDDDAIGWASGEGLMLAGPDGVGKTTLGQQIAIARAGLRAQVLGLNVAADGRRVLYCACDRPRQALRSMRRMVTPSERDQLNDAMTIWKGPLPAMLNEDRTILTRLAKQFDAGTVIVDSLKDVAVDLSTDEAGGRIAASFQHAIAAGVELLVLHHPRKPGVDQSRKPRELSDVYGNRLIFGVFGSVIMLWGDPGDAFIDLDHLKQPVDPLGPWKLHHDHPRGRTEIEHGTDLIDLVLAASTTGLTVKTAAALVYDKPEPNKNQTENVRQRLEKLARSGRIVKHPGARGSEPTRYLYNGPAEALQ